MTDDWSPWSVDPSEPDSVCQQVREEAAISLLTRQEPSAVVRSHLEVCPPCLGEFTELTALPPLLEHARQARLAPVPETPGDDLLERLLAHVHRRRRRRRIAVAVALTSAAAMLLAVLPFVRVEMRDDRATGTPPPTASTTAGEPVVAAGTGTDATTGAQARVLVRREGAGSSLSVWVKGVARGRTCRMIVHDAAGTATNVGLWTVGSADDTNYVEDIALQPTLIRRIELIDDLTGRAIVDIPVTRT